MNHSPRSAVPWWAASVFSFTAALVLFGTVATAQDLVHVEEDWELVLGQPDLNVCGPQISTTMSPYNHISDTLFTLEINHRSLPYWTPGGLTIHEWSGDWRLQSWDRSDRTVMNTENETVTWTQILDVTSGQLTFQIKDGVSTTWGPFGYSNYFKLQTTWGVNHINGYTPDVSISQSGVTYAGNRVQSLKLNEIRLQLDDGTTLIDNTVRVAHQLVVE